jgi:hypothetical protein
MQFFPTVYGESMSGYWLYTGSSFSDAPFWGTFKAIKGWGSKARHSLSDELGQEPYNFTHALNRERGR